MGDNRIYLLLNKLTSEAFIKNTISQLAHCTSCPLKHNRCTNFIQCGESLYNSMMDINEEHHDKVVEFILDKVNRYNMFDDNRTAFDFAELVEVAARGDNE